MNARELPVIVIKTGGRVASDDILMAFMAEELVALPGIGYRVLLVHGGGSTITELQQRYGVTPRFIEGLRQTDPEEMPIVDMALAGSMNKKLVRMLTVSGGKVWGLSGADAGTIVAESRSGDADTNRTGFVTSVDTSALKLLWDNSYIPVLAPVASDSQGRGINVNADEAALAIATALKAHQLVYISDVPGVLEDADLIPLLTPEQIEEKIAADVIGGGMIPKTRSAASALAEGVGEVVIGDYQKTGNLKELLSGSRGTRIVAEGVQHG